MDGEKPITQLNRHQLREFRERPSNQHQGAADAGYADIMVILVNQSLLSHWSAS